MTIKQMLVGGMLGAGTLGMMLYRLPQTQMVLAKSSIRLSSRISQRFVKTHPLHLASSKLTRKKSVKTHTDL